MIKCFHIIYILSHVSHCYQVLHLVQLVSIVREGCKKIKGPHSRVFLVRPLAFIFLEPFPYNCYQLLQLVQLVQSWCAASGVGLDLCHCYQRRPGLWKGLGSSYTASDKQTCSRINIPPTRLLFFGTFCKDYQNKHVHSLTFQPCSLEEGELNHSIPALKLGISVGIRKRK